jgi:hypothetical protein
MGGHFTEADVDYYLLSDSMGFVRDNETAMEMYFAIKSYESRYPNYYRVTLLREKFMQKIDRLERLDFANNNN